MTEQAPEAPVRDLPPIHVVPIGDVREAEHNPRKIPERAVELVAHSLRRFGWKQPLVVDKDGTIVVGHTRHRAARALGLAKVPTIIADDLTPAEIDAYRIADNRTSDFTTWDLPELSLQLAGLEEEFAEVLALADWDAVTARMDGLDADLGLDLPAGAVASLHEGFQLSVRFETKQQALDAQQVIIDLPGVFDVRHNF